MNIRYLFFPLLVLSFGCTDTKRHFKGGIKSAHIKREKPQINPANQKLNSNIKIEAELSPAASSLSLVGTAEVVRMVLRCQNLEPIVSNSNTFTILTTPTSHKNCIYDLIRFRIGDTELSEL